MYLKRNFYLSVGSYSVIFSPRFLWQEFLQDSCSCLSYFVLTGRYSYLYWSILFCLPCSLQDHRLLLPFPYSRRVPVSLKSVWGLDELQCRQWSGRFIPAHWLLSGLALPLASRCSMGTFFVSPFCSCVDFLCESAVQHKFSFSLCSVHFK